MMNSAAAASQNGACTYQWVQNARPREMEDECAEQRKEWNKDVNLEE